jgi:hypothetical protein
MKRPWKSVGNAKTMDKDGERQSVDMLDPNHVYFPDFTNEEFGSFSIPFCRLMFASAELDRPVVDVVLCGGKDYAR